MPEVTYKVPTPSEMLQLGHSCGLNSVAEAYDMMMRHYDAFFIIDSINEQLAEFHANLVATSLATVRRQMVMAEMTIKDAAKLLGYELMDYDETMMSGVNLDAEDCGEIFEFNPFEVDVETDEDGNPDEDAYEVS